MLERRIRLQLEVGDATVDWVAIGSVSTAFGSMATAVTAWFIRQELGHSRKQALSGFEDQLEREYREIVAEIPVGALLGAKPEDPMPSELLGVFYRYIDLTNQQVFLRSQQRISAATWANWRDGIAHQLRRPAFAAAWAKIKHDADKDFFELRQLEKRGFTEDPADWSTPPTATPQQPDAHGPASSRAA